MYISIYICRYPYSHFCSRFFEQHHVEQRRSPLLLLRLRWRRLGRSTSRTTRPGSRRSARSRGPGRTRWSGARPPQPKAASRGPSAAIRRAEPRWRCCGRTRDGTRSPIGAWSKAMAKTRTGPWPLSSRARSRPDAPIKCACTWPTSGTHYSATHSMAGALNQSYKSFRKACRTRSGDLTGKPFMQKDWHSFTR